MAYLYNKIIPEADLEMCSNCFKFLNVKPIKTYANHKVRCGRCTKSGDEGVLSSHNNIDDDRLFKCVNKFDGCRMLLTTSQVAQHESTCVSKVNRCPYCQLDDFIPTYLLEKHFKEYHNLYLLKSNEILIFEDNTKKTYLYKHNDHLFFIVVEFRSKKNVFKLSSISIGIHNKVKVSFDVKKLESVIDSNRVLTSHESLSRRLNNIQMAIHIQVTIKAEVMSLAYFPLSNVEDDINPDLNTLQKLAEKQLLKRFQFFSGICLISNIIWPPTVDRSSLPEDYITGQNSTHLIKVNLTKNTKLYLHCYNCFNSSFGCTISGGFVTLNNNNFFLCDICYNLEKNRDNIINLGGFNKPEPLIHIKYNCMWNCGSKDVFSHSYFCENQTYFHCPFDDCLKRAPLNELFTHLNHVHNIQSDNTFIWNISLKSDLLCNGTVIERYIWVMPYFVKVKFIACDNFWKIQIKFQSNITVPEDLRVKVLLFSETGKMLNIVTQDCGVHLKPTDNLAVHCILDMNDDVEHVNNE